MDHRDQGDEIGPFHREKQINYDWTSISQAKEKQEKETEGKREVGEIARCQGLYSVFR